MKNCIKDLYPSLVGSHIEFRVSGKVSTDTVEATRSSIEQDLQDARNVGGSLEIYLITELISYYKKQNYYGSIRSSIRIGRHYKEVQEWLDKSTSFRVDHYITMLERKKINKSLLLKIIKYIAQGTPKYLKVFRKILTTEEYYYVA